MPDSTFNWLPVITGIGIPIMVLSVTMLWRVMDQMRKLRAEIRAELDVRIAALESFRATAPNDFADREDFVRESLLLRREVQELSRLVAELRGESSAAVRVAQGIAVSIDRLAVAISQEPDHANKA